MNDDVTLSIRQMDGAWRLMCAGTPQFVEAATDGIQFIFSGLPVSFFNLALLTGSDLSAEELSARGREACAWAAAQSVPWLLMVTHEMNFARKVSDRVVFMHAGRIHEMGAPEELFGAPKTAELQQFLSALH